MKLYVWERFATDYTDGLAVALAENVKEARALVKAALGELPVTRPSYLDEELNKPHRVYPIDVARAFAVKGGG